ncbi:hypothetical protein PGT21_036548 [Puccinia graminis f. sp. tritici]|uniref:Uncharacterized protein n=1 Tax=Puccinia graminis f. sp. tritici TaxID=56615 RepID=A0A5B0NIT1_PUCGR|nr:hypothetical protein PGT21_036548 [Puccinia graminis f. sp. tritici]KAA1138132.1 hypothetical protein PGTUg99_003855 [Puccinia graminis f. sp. tritici]
MKAEVISLAVAFMSPTETGGQSKKERKGIETEFISEVVVQALPIGQETIRRKTIGGQADYR